MEVAIIVFVGVLEATVVRVVDGEAVVDFVVVRVTVGEAAVVRVVDGEAVVDFVVVRVTVGEAAVVRVVDGEAVVDFVVVRVTVGEAAVVRVVDGEAVVDFVVVRVTVGEVAAVRVVDGEAVVDFVVVAVREGERVWVLVRVALRDTDFVADGVRELENKDGTRIGRDGNAVVGSFVGNTGIVGSSVAGSSVFNCSGIDGSSDKILAGIEGILGIDGSSVRVGMAGMDGYSVTSDGIDGSFVGSAGTVNSGIEGISGKLTVGNVEGISGMGGSSVAGIDGILIVGIVAGNESVGSMDGKPAIRDWVRPVSIDGKAVIVGNIGIEGRAVYVRVGRGVGAFVFDGNTDLDGRILAGIENPPNWRLRAATDTAVAAKKNIERRNISSGSS